MQPCKRLWRRPNGIGPKLTLRLDERLIQMLTLFAVAPVDRSVLDRALDLDFTDFEDAVLHEAARNAGAAAIVTRDAADLANATAPVFDPRELLAAVAAAAE